MYILEFLKKSKNRFSCVSPHHNQEKDPICFFLKAIVTRVWAGLKVVSKECSQKVDIAGAQF